MKYYEDFEAMTLDELQAAGSVELTTFNVNVSSDTTILRGDLLAGSSFSDTFKLATNSDTNKILCIARDNFIADSEHTVTAVFTSGNFHLNRINSSDTAVVLQNELRKQNIHLARLEG